MNIPPEKGCPVGDGTAAFLLPQQSTQRLEFSHNKLSSNIQEGPMRSTSGFYKDLSDPRLLSKRLLNKRCGLNPR